MKTMLFARSGPAGSQVAATDRPSCCDRHPPASRRPASGAPPCPAHAGIALLSPRSEAAALWSARAPVRRRAHPPRCESHESSRSRPARRRRLNARRPDAASALHLAPEEPCDRRHGEDDDAADQQCLHIHDFRKNEGLARRAAEQEVDDARIDVKAVELIDLRIDQQRHRQSDRAQGTQRDHDPCRRAQHDRCERGSKKNGRNAQ